jgi:hypothetical protein
MERTLGEKIANLEKRIEVLKKELGDPTRSTFARNETKIDLGTAERSLEHFKKAYELERKISR